jgi:hypothetical protein
LTNSVEIFKLSNNNFTLILFVQMNTTEKILTVCSVVKNGCIVHVIFKNCYPLEVLMRNLTQEIKLFTLLFHDNRTVLVRTHMPSHLVLGFVPEFLALWLCLTVVILLEATRHSKVVHKKGVLVDVLKDTEPTCLSEGQFEAIMEMVPRGELVPACLLVSSCTWSHCHARITWRGSEELGDVRSVEAIEVFGSPVELAEGQVLDARSMVELLTKVREHLANPTELWTLLVVRVAARVRATVFVARIPWAW